MAGREPALAALGGPAPLDVTLTVASGDLVLAQCRVGREGDARVEYHVARMADAAIAEPWTVRQPLTPPDEAANRHPHF